MLALKLVALVKSLVQRLNGRGGRGLRAKGNNSRYINAEQVFQDIIREVKLAVQVDVLRTHERDAGAQLGQQLLALRPVFGEGRFSCAMSSQTAASRALACKG